MAAFFLSKKDVNGHRDHSAGSSRPPPPLPQPDHGDNVRTVPDWEIEFCRNAYDIPWETFCENKRYIGLHRKVMEWDDSGARKNFEAAKKRFKAKYFGTNWNCFSGGNQRDKEEGQHQQRNGDGMQRNQNEVQQQLRSGGSMQRNKNDVQHQQRNGGSMPNLNEVQHHYSGVGWQLNEMGVKTYPVLYFRRPKDDPAV